MLLKNQSTLNEIRDQDLNNTMEIIDSKWQEWDRFVTQAISGSYTQTSMWAQAKAAQGWKSAQIQIPNQDGQINAGAQIFYRPVTMGLQVGAIPKGPIYADSSDLKTIDHALKTIKTFCKRHQIVFLSLSLPEDKPDIIELARENGFFKALQGNIDTTADIIIDLSPELDEIYAQISKNRRKLIRRGETRGISIRQGGYEDLDVFYPLYMGNSERIGFTPFSRAFFDNLWKGFEPCDGVKIFIAEYLGEPVTASICIVYKGKFVDFKIGWSGKHSDLYPNDALLWYRIRWAKAHGCQHFYFGGIEPPVAKAILNGEKMPEEFIDNYSNIKTHYGGQVITYPDTFEYIHPTWLNQAYQTIYPAFTQSAWVKQLLRSICKK